MCDKYSEIIKEKLGESYLINSAQIKEDQCKTCKHKGKIKKCRLIIERGKCKNYESKSKNKF